MNFRIRLLVAAYCLALSTSTGHTGAEDCQEAIDKYNRVIRDVEFAVRSYTICLSGSRGRDNCSVEFFSLQSAQDDFERAVRRYRQECD